MAGSLKTFFVRAGRNAAGFFFPPLCVVCRGRCTEGNPWLCGPCASNLVRNHDNRNACPLCSQNRSVRQCACGYAWDHPFEKIVSLFDFDDTVKEIAHAFKYGGFKKLAYYMGKTYAKLAPEDFFSGMDCVVPVPLHFIRRLKRGYNQAEWFTRGIAASGAGHLCFCTGALKRRRATRTQTALSKDQRVKNLAGAFHVPALKIPLIKGKSIILVDDIVTTGATTGQCATALLVAGAKCVRVLSFARD